MTHNYRRAAQSQDEYRLASKFLATGLCFPVEGLFLWQGSHRFSQFR
jgi:hypothetical protein